MRITGDNGAIELQSGTTYSALACFRDFTIDEPRNYPEATCMGDGNLVYSEGKRDFTGQGTAMVDTDDLDVLTTIRGGGAKDLRIYFDKTNATNYHYDGDIFLSGGLSVAVGQPVAMNLAMRAAGTITLTTS
jgi:hypothetical protein